MKSVTILDLYNYRVDSYGNGTAYSITRWQDGASVFLQGDDAAAFRDDLDAAPNARALGHILDAYDDVMA